MQEKVRQSDSIMVYWQHNSFQSIFTEIILQARRYARNCGQEMSKTWFLLSRNCL